MIPNIRHEISGDIKLLVLFCDTSPQSSISVQVDTATDNHNDNAIFTEDDERIVNIVAELLGIDAENLKQVELIVNCGSLVNQLTIRWLW